MNKNQKMPRKLRKILVEKKRRERIDGCLKQIKELLFQGTEFQNDYMRMEKADILENVVKFIKCQNVHERSDRGSSEYRLGYIHCMREVTQVMEQICGKSSTPMIAIQHYFNNKLNNLTYSDTRTVVKEESPSSSYSSLAMSSIPRSGAFSPVYQLMHPLDSCSYQKTSTPSYYFGEPRTVPIKVEPNTDRETKVNNNTSKRALKRKLDSSFETVQDVPDSTSQISVHIPEQENIHLQNNDNNNNGNVVQRQNDDDMWRPW